ncbi:MAG: MBL fold metallo-hydrolase [Candidatus Heimdallarchaeota archaeon]
MTFEKINENLYLYKEEDYFDVIMGAIVLPSKIVMIDSGINMAKAKEFREYVEKKTKKKTEILFITHSHMDHTQGNQIFADCRIISSPDVLVMMNHMIDNLTAEDLEEMSSDGFVVTPPTETHDYLEIIDGDVKVIFKNTGGHTADSSYVYCDPEKWLVALKEYQSLDAEYYISGHQGICYTKNIRGYIAFINLMKTTIQEMHADEKTKEEIIEELTPLKPFATTENYPKLERLKQATLENWYNFWTKD